MLRVENEPVLNFGLASDLGFLISDFLSDGRNHHLLSVVCGLWSVVCGLWSAFPVFYLLSSFLISFPL
jgi:hypothetical protein